MMPFYHANTEVLLVVMGCFGWALVLPFFLHMHQAH